MNQSNEKTETKPPPAYTRSERPTIMDGKVITFAPSFSGDGSFANSHKAEGCFEISASRNAVMVHRCSIGSHKNKFEDFIKAMNEAWEAHRVLDANRHTR